MQADPTGVCIDEVTDEIFVLDDDGKTMSLASGFSGTGKLVLRVLVQRSIEFLD